MAAHGLRGRWEVSRPAILAGIGLLVILVAYAWIEIAHFTPAYREEDPDGYVLLAKRLADGAPLAVRDDDIFAHQSHVWVENHRGEVVPKFAPGFSAVLGVFYRIGGDEAMFLVSPICGVLALIGAYLLFRLWMSRLAALAGTACLAANGMFLIYTGFILSHALDTCVIAWGMYFLIRWLRGGGLGTAVSAGLLLGFACTVRHINAFLAFAVVTAAVARVSADFRAGRQRSPVSAPALGGRGATNTRATAVGLLVAYSVFPLLMALYNQALFGDPLITGYYFSNEQYAFSSQQAWEKFRDILMQLGSRELYLIFTVGLVGLAVIGPGAEGLIRWFWVLPFFVIYSGYYWWFYGMTFLRFFLPVFPAIIGAAFALLDRLSLPPVRKGIALFGLVGLIVARSYEDIRRFLPMVVSNPIATDMVTACRAVAGTLPDDAVIFARPPYTDCLGTRRHFRLYDLRAFRAGHGAELLAGVARPRQQAARLDRLMEFYRHHSDAELEAMKRKLVQQFLQTGRQVALLIPCQAETDENQRLGPEFSLVRLKEFAAHAYDEPGRVPWGIYEVRSAPADQTPARRAP